MTHTLRSMFTAVACVASVISPLAMPAAQARSAAQISAQGARTLADLEAVEPRSRYFANHAHAVLIFPSIIKGGLIFGGEHGNGVLLRHGRTQGYYSLTGGSWGLQAGFQDFSYVVFLMTDGAVRHLNRSGGWSVGTGPSVVVINQGANAVANTETMKQDVVAFPFNGKGLMADLTLQGTKISHIHPR